MKTPFLIFATFKSSQKKRITIGYYIANLTKLQEELLQFGETF